LIIEHNGDISPEKEKLLLVKVQDPKQMEAPVYLDGFIMIPSVLNYQKEM